MRPERQPKLMNLSAFARLAGVTPQTIHSMATAGLKPCMSGKGRTRKINATHPLALAYIKAKGGDTSPLLWKPTPESARRPTAPADPPENEIPLDDDGEPAEVDLDELIRTQPIDTALKKLDAQKKAADIRGKRTLNDERMGRLISRAFMDQYIFGALDTLHQRLLTDVPRTIARRMYALCRSDAPEEAAERVVSELISAQLKAAKENMDSAIAKFVKTRDAEAGGSRMGRP